MKYRILSSFLIGLIFCAVLPGPATRAEELEPSLDARLAANDTPGLIKLMQQHQTPEEQPRIVHWLKAKVDSGEAPDQFAMTLAFLGFRSGKPEEGLLYLNYLRTLIMLDFPPCKDAAAGSSLLEGTIFLFAKVTKDATPAQKTASIDQALALEQKTATVRKPDPSFCPAAAGSATTASGSAAGPNTAEVAPKPKPVPAIALAADPAWQKKRQAALPDLKQQLIVMNGLYTPK